MKFIDQNICHLVPEKPLTKQGGPGIQAEIFSRCEEEKTSTQSLKNKIGSYVKGTERIINK